MLSIALMGAGGKNGPVASLTASRESRTTRSPPWKSPRRALARLAERGVTPTPQAQALAGANVVILAIPDALIGKVTHEIVPTLRPGTIVIGLDPAAGYAEVMPVREDLTYFVCHPCHPPLFAYESDPRAQNDWFGGIAKMDLVCALYHGREEDYPVAEKVCRDMFAPVGKAFRITIEQMAILEPALVEDNQLLAYHRDEGKPMMR